MPQRPSPRAATTGEHHAQLAGRLTHRDRWLTRMLYEHKVFTTQQIVELCYPSMRAANHRLLDLFKWRVVDRFQPFVTTGTAPMHYVLDIAGAVALAYEDGLDPKSIGYRHEDAIGIAHSLRLAHTVGVNGFFTALVALGQRSEARGALTAWWSELRCGRLFGDMVRPDAYGRWREDGHQLEFFLEFDFGTEDLGKLSRKLYGYGKLAAATGITTPVLIWLPTHRREASARRALADCLSQLDRPRLVPLATSAADAAGDPAGARWLPIAGPATRHPGRLPLVELAQLWPQPDLPGDVPVSSPVPAQQAPAALTAPDPFPPASLASRFRRRP
jgi:hypothetical protein